MDSGKTSALQGILLRNAAYWQGKTLIICTEDGEEEFDETLLAEKNIEVAFVEDEDELTSDCLIELANNCSARCVYIEFNGTWDLKRFLADNVPSDWTVSNVFALVNAETYEMYLKNMRQIIMNPLSVADVILFNRCSEKTRKGNFRRSLKILNNRAEVHFARTDGRIDDSIEDFFLPDEDGIIYVDDEIFCPWFVDCIENTDKYYGRKVRANIMTTLGSGLVENQFYVGRMAAICCAEDAQFIGFVAECQGFVPKKGEWLDITATIKKGSIDNDRAIILLDIEDAKKIQQPEDIYLYF